ncbi:MAG: hypothetical protein JNJ85_17160 [Candidatus Kapabacteria bacterium]|nr:hypothetical protein [Candidatus Kapabacteria bacterium]
MKSTKDCKVLFNTLIQRMWRNSQDDPIVDNPFYAIEDVISFTMKQSKKKRFYDLKDDKFCFIESAYFIREEGEPTIITGLFKSARNEFRPNLINKRTGEERKNPKEITEGDVEKTHFAIKLDENSKEVYFFIEYNFHGVSLTSAVNYFGIFNDKYLVSKELKKNYSVKHLVIPRNNFLTELEHISRTKLAEIYFDKQLLGSKALNFSNRMVSLKKDLKLVASASTQESITEVAIDFYNAMTRKDSPVSKVRIHGNDENNNEVILDTSFMSKEEFVKVDINSETGEVNTTQLLTGLKKIAKTF